MSGAPAQNISRTSATNGAQVFAGTVHGNLNYGSNTDLLQALIVAKDAPFNALVRQHEPECLENTRVELLEKIYDWANGHDERSIFWLSGWAGTGKSTIARTVARTFSELEPNRLGASFFFLRGGGDVGRADRFVTTIVRQLCDSIPTLQQYVRDAIKKHPDFANQFLSDQWRHLVLDPLSELDGSISQQSYILVIDSLDECENGNDIRLILKLLGDIRYLKKVQLRVFLTSRPEVLIREGIREVIHQKLILHNISSSIVDHDIEVFLRHELEHIACMHSLGAGWPDEQIVRQLIGNANGLFIWAATACRFIDEGRSLAASRISIILKSDYITDSASGSSSDNSATVEAHNDPALAPEKHLDRLYTAVIQNSINMYKTPEERKKWRKRLKTILGIIVLLPAPLSTLSLNNLLDLTQHQMKRTLNDLHAILEIPEDPNSPLRLHHPSLRDFLLNRERCEALRFKIDEKEIYQTLAVKCLQCMLKSLKQDICGLNAPGLLTADVKIGQIEQSLPPEVQYACLYWVQHLQKSSLRLHEDGKVHKFLQEHLLHWLEALGWMGRISEGVRAIASLESFASSLDCPNLASFIRDAKRFVLYNRLAIEQAPLQIYCSALIFTPTSSIVKRTFKGQVPSWVQRIRGVRREWGATLLVLEGHSDKVVDIAFSPDCKQIASASWDKTVRLWDINTGATLQTLEGYSESIVNIAFSPDCKKMASISWDKTVRLWDANTGATLQILEGHGDDVVAVAFSPVAFSPDCKQMALASWDKTVRLWDANTGATLQTLEGHSDKVVAVAFSPDCKQIASASWDKTVRLWDANTGATLQTLEGHSDKVVAVAFSPDCKQVASASWDNTVRLWDVNTGAALQTLEGHSANINAFEYSTDGKQLVSHSSYNKTLRIWDIGRGGVLRTLIDHHSDTSIVRFSLDGKLIASGSADKTIRICDAATGKRLQTLVGHSDEVSAIAFSPDCKQVASASWDKTVRLWDITKLTVEEAPQTLGANLNWIEAVAISPDGKQLVSAWADGLVRLFNVATGESLHILKHHSGELNPMAVAFSPKGKRLASASSAGGIKLWDTVTGIALQTFPPPEEWNSHLILAVAISPDNKQLASASGSSVHLWDVAKRKSIKIGKHAQPVVSLIFSYDGKQLASASSCSEFRLWNAATGDVLQDLHTGNC